MTFPESWLPIELDRINNTVTFLKIDYPLNLDTPSFNRSVENYKAAYPDAEEKIGSITDLQHFKNIGQEPKGLIFQASRVGSTAVAQALTRVFHCFAFSEPNLVNAAIRVDEAPVEVLQLVFRGLSQFHQLEDQLVIKHSSWNITRANVLFEAYPNIPWVFLYRDPVEIMVSVADSPTGWARAYKNPNSANELLGLDPKVVEAASYETYLALSIDKMFRSALEYANGNALFINYAQFGIEQIKDIARHFNIDLTSGDIDAIAHSLKFYSKGKDRSRQFVPDTERKQAQASPAIREAAKYAADSYRNLEAKRQG